MRDWKKFKNILCIRADNMGDLIMTTPAFRALKETFNCNITLLTSRAGAVINNHLSDVDEVIVHDLPWVKSLAPDPSTLLILADQIRIKEFDAAIIFTVYSQSALPAAMLTYMAEIPNRLAYSRENPYDLLTDWIPDPEPYTTISHQVERDLALVAHIGAHTSNDTLEVRLRSKNRISLRNKLSCIGIESEEPWIIMHPGVSEDKRKYPDSSWIETGKMLVKKYRIPLLITGSKTEKKLTDYIASEIGPQAFSVAGIVTIGEFIAAIARAKCVVSVNTSTVHIAAALQIPVVVLYAQTNPQHTPWKSSHKLLQFSVPENLQSKNMIVRYVSDRYYRENLPYPSPQEVVKAVSDLMLTETDEVMKHSTRTSAA